MRKQKILITGVLGYVATAICERLIACEFRNCNSEDFEIIGIDNQFNDRVAWLVENNIQFFQRDLFNIRDLLKDVDIVIHCGATTSVPTTLEQSSLEIDKEIYRVCVEGTREILTYTERTCKIIFLSSHTVFDGLTQQVLNMTEGCPPCPLVAYSHAKFISERDLFLNDNPFVILRLGSVTGYGRNQRINIVSNLFAKLASQNQPIKIFGNGENIKPLVCVKDVAECVERILYQSHFNRQIYHLVSENLTVKQIADICKKYNPNLLIENTLDKIPNLGYSLSNEKILSTGFEFKQTIDESIGEMIKIWSNK